MQVLIGGVILPKDTTVKEIIIDQKQLQDKLKRVDFISLGKKSVEDISFLVSKYEQALINVNTKKHAKLLIESLEGKENLIYLSTNIYPLERKAIIEKVKCFLKKTNLLLWFQPNLLRQELI